MDALRLDRVMAIDIALEPDATMLAHAEDELISYVTDFMPEASGDNFNPHVTTGVGTVDYLDQMLTERFDPFSFAVVGAALYQLGTYGTAQKRLDTLA